MFYMFLLRVLTRDLQKSNCIAKDAKVMSITLRLFGTSGVKTNGWPVARCAKTLRSTRMRTDGLSEMFVPSRFKG